MKADSHQLNVIFGKDIRYEVPLYQRPYVWNVKDQLEPFLQDVLETAGHVMDAAEGATIAPHFMGAIVLDQRWSGTGDIETRLVVDGQQRLTTLQIFLAAAALECSAAGLTKHARQLRRLVDNDEDLAPDPAARGKVLPTNSNRTAFAAVTRVEGPPVDREDDPTNLIDEAFGYFTDGIATWLGGADGIDGGLELRADALVRAVKYHVKLVVIDLEPEDDAQVIFETLNHGGQKLLAIDLVKNHVFQLGLLPIQVVDAARAVS